jgi:DNA invertase Pin-like site-specific DNA recombinase
MSNSTKKSASKGVRYTDAQKKEVVDFVNEYNAANGRGGQSKAAEKYNISQLTVASWIKGGEASKTAKVAKQDAAPKAENASQAPKAVKAKKAAKAPKPAKAAKAPKAAKAAKPKKAGVGTRYTDAQKKEVVDFAVAYNAANGRGGQSKAAAKFKVSPLTVVSWLKAAGVKKATKKSAGKAANASKAPKAKKAARAPKAAKAKASAGNPSSSLAALTSKIQRIEKELEAMKSKFKGIKASI